jgi:hypothetical protein
MRHFPKAWYGRGAEAEAQRPIHAIETIIGCRRMQAGARSGKFFLMMRLASDVSLCPGLRRWQLDSVTAQADISTAGRFVPLKTSAASVC